jgi:hypothetical protein
MAGIIACAILLPMELLLNILLGSAPILLMLLLAGWAYRIKKQKEKRLDLKWKIEEIFPD